MRPLRVTFSVRWVGLRLKIGDYEIPEHCLKSVSVYPELSTVAFTGVFVGEHEAKTGAGLRYLAEMRALPYEAVDKNGVASSGVCDIKDFKLVDGSLTVKFSGRLVRPFQE
jgi:hypothetical protein